MCLLSYSGSSRHTQQRVQQRQQQQHQQQQQQQQQQPQQHHQQQQQQQQQQLHFDVLQMIPHVGNTMRSSCNHGWTFPFDIGFQSIACFCLHHTKRDHEATWYFVILQS